MLNKPLGNPESFHPISLLCVPLRSSRMSSMLVSNQLSIQARNQLGTRVVNELHFQVQIRPEPVITSPNPDRVRHLFLKPNFSPKATFTEWDKVCATAEYQKMQCTGIATCKRFYHTQNSNRLDQNIGLDKHRLSLLVNDNYAE